jgi:phage antirepressor YoqD-like protein
MESLTIKTKTRKEVAEEYGICEKTLNRWLKRNNIIIHRGLIDPHHLMRIYETFGVPNSPIKS